MPLRGGCAVTPVTDADLDAFLIELGLDGIEDAARLRRRMLKVLAEIRAERDLCPQTADVSGARRLGLDYAADRLSAALGVL